MVLLEGNLNFLEEMILVAKLEQPMIQLAHGFQDSIKDLVTTVWVGTDDFTSLGEDEYGSTIALPIWINYMDFKLKSLEISNEEIPENISFVRVNKNTGEIDKESLENTYFELFLDENIN